jgi:D-alanine transfer protein
VTPSTPDVSASSPRPHLAAALGALSFLVIAASGVGWWGERAERNAFPGMLPLFAEPKEHAESDHSNVAYIEHLKNQGIAIQQRGFERPDILPLYGSSELVKRIPDKSSLFFRNFPTGFSVFPIGKAGTTPLIILEKVGAVGETVHGRKVAISLSPSWFFPGPNPDHAYAGNFSRQQTFAALLNPALSFGFKRDFAQRLLVHPATLQKEPLLRFLVARLARGSHLDHAAFAAVWPLARLNQEVYAAQDHFESALFVKLFKNHLSHAPEVVPAPLDWDALIAQASSDSGPAGPGARDPLGHKVMNDAAFREAVAYAPEWQDLELLLRGLHEMGAMTLVLCMPPNGVYFEHSGVSKESLDLFAARVRAIAVHYGAQVEAFEDHEEDVNFLVDHHDHMSAKGWMYYNRALDEFYHTAPEQLEATFAKGHRKRLRATPPPVPLRTVRK